MARLCTPGELRPGPTRVRNARCSPARATVTTGAVLFDPAKARAVGPDHRRPRARSPDDRGRALHPSGSRSPVTDPRRPGGSEPTVLLAAGNVDANLTA